MDTSQKPEPMETGETNEEEKRIIMRKTNTEEETKTERSIQSLPTEICIKIIDYLPHIKTRFSLRRVCPEFRNVIDARVCWKSRKELIIEVGERGWWYSVNGCRVSGSRKRPKCTCIHSYKRLKENVCEGIRAMFSRINIKKIRIEGIDYLKSVDILLTLAGQMLEHEYNRSDRQLRSVKFFGTCRLTQPLLFSIFIPVASGLDHLRLAVRTDQPKLSPAVQDSICRLIKCSDSVLSLSIWPVFSLRCLEAIKGRRLNALSLSSELNFGLYFARMWNALPAALAELQVFGVLENGFRLPDLLNKEQLHTIAFGYFRRHDIEYINNMIRELATFPNIRHVMIFFHDSINCPNVVSIVTALFAAFRTRFDIYTHDRPRSVWLQLCSQCMKKDKNWPQESVKQALEDEQIEVFATRSWRMQHSYFLSVDSQFKWLGLRKNNVCVGLYCNCIYK